MHYWKETGYVDPLIEKKLLLSGTDDADRDEWWPSTGRHEVTFAIELESGTLYLYSDRGRYNESDTFLGADAWKSKFPANAYLTGTIDYVDGPHVDDLKTGWEPDVTTSGQLRSYALVPWILRGRQRWYRGLISITHFPRYPLAARPTRSWDVVTGAELALHLESLRDAVTNPTAINPSDDSCRFCPSRTHCPAQPVDEEK